MYTYTYSDRPLFLKTLRWLSISLSKSPYNGLGRPKPLKSHISYLSLPCSQRASHISLLPQLWPAIHLQLRSCCSLCLKVSPAEIYRGFRALFWCPSIREDFPDHPLYRGKNPFFLPHCSHLLPCLIVTMLLLIYIYIFWNSHLTLSFPSLKTSQRLPWWFSG